MNEDVLAAVLAALGCGSAGLLVPAGIRRIPQPAPGPVVEPVDEPLLSFVEVAGSVGLGARTATVAAVVGASIGYAVGPSWVLLVLLPLVPVGVLLAVVDWCTQLLPKAAIVPTYALAIATCLVTAAIEGRPHWLLGALIGWAVIGGIYFVFWFVYPPGLGYGDVRLAGILGIVLGFLGYRAASTGLLLGLIIGGVGGALLTLLRVVDRRNVPFGPFMLVGAWVGVLVAAL
ncbi:hypothetical protein BH11ACT8_BH11ACT8_26800 [soil metagenome]